MGEKDISEEIAVLKALQYEKKHERIAQSVESEDLGYDLKSNSKTAEERFIEVKGLKKLEEGKITLTPNEIWNCMEKKDRYFVYLVTNTLQDPTLNIIQGDKINYIILNERKMSVMLDYKEWKKFAKEVY